MIKIYLFQRSGSWITIAISLPGSSGAPFKDVTLSLHQLYIICVSPIKRISVTFYYEATGGTPEIWIPLDSWRSVPCLKNKTPPDSGASQKSTWPRTNGKIYLNGYYCHGKARPRWCRGCHPGRAKIGDATREKWRSKKVASWTSWSINSQN